MKLTSSFNYKVVLNGKEFFLKRWTTKNEKEFLLARLNLKENDKVSELLFNTLLFPNIQYNGEFLSEFEKIYLLMELRKISFGNTFEARFQCEHCGKQNEMEFELDKVIHYKPENFSPIQEKTEDGDEIIIEFKGIKTEAAKNKIDQIENPVEKAFKIFILSISKITLNGVEYNDFTPEELEEFFEELDVKTFDKIMEKFNEMNESLELYYENCTCAFCRKQTKVRFEDIPGFLPW